MFKYQTYFENLSVSCPPRHYTVHNKMAFRWVFDKLNVEDSFIPVYFKNPKRFNEKSDEERCKALGLSFFETLETAERRFYTTRKTIGTRSV